MTKPNVNASCMAAESRRASLSTQVFPNTATSIKIVEKRPIPSTVIKEMNAQANDARPTKSGR
ncbi:hypothetical protein GCM10009504_07290 [Pseudomonas laurentiana]|nr:hypothetical protein GCM10009504_07290 [Pseudomonas laurentiana]